MPKIHFRLNGAETEIDADPDTPLLSALRGPLGLTGSHFGCGAGECGACTVIVNDHAINSCDTPLWSIANKDITTIEGLSAKGDHPLQKAWIAEQVPQCGYCQSGQIMSASALIASNPHPTEADIDDAMSGNICRCGTYVRIREAIKEAAQSSGQRG